MIVKVVIVLAGIVGGGVIGYYGKCTTGGCPLTSNPYMGAIFGGIFGFAVTTMIGAAPPESSAGAYKSDALVSVESPKQFNRLISDNDVVLVDFYADWCPPCKQLKPTIHRLADEFEGRAVVAAVNVEENSELAREHGISAIPDVRIFKLGEQAGQFTGVRAKEVYAERLNALLNE